MQRASASAPLTVGRGILNAARRFPQNIALEDEARSLSYRELADRMRRLGAAAIDEWELAAGEVVVLLSPNRLEYMEIVAGLAEAGLIVATLNPRLSASELQNIVEDCRPAMAIIDPVLGELHQALEAEAVPTLSLGDDYEALLTRSTGTRRRQADEYAAFSLCYASGTTGNSA